MSSSTAPRWATTARKDYLAKLALQYLSGGAGWKCDIITGEFHHSGYEKRINALIRDWASYDREEDRAEWLEEQKRIHSLGEKVLPLRGRFSAVARSIYHDQQPLYYLVGLGMSGLTLRPFAKVRLASSYECLYIDLGDSLRRLGKHKRRKAIRYGVGIPLDIERKVSALIHAGVMHCRTH